MSGKLSKGVLSFVPNSILEPLGGSVSPFLNFPVSIPLKCSNRERENKKLLNFVDLCKNEHSSFFQTLFFSFRIWTNIGHGLKCNSRVVEWVAQPRMSIYFSTRANAK